MYLNSSIVLGLDHGKRKTGVASAHLGTRNVTPQTIIASNDMGAMQLLIDKWKPMLLVIGLPLNLDGSRGKRVAEVCSYARKLSDMFRLPIFFQDERLSTHATRHAQASYEYLATRKKSKKHHNLHCFSSLNFSVDPHVPIDPNRPPRSLDHLAATAILTDWLNTQI